MVRSIEDDGRWMMRLKERRRERRLIKVLGGLVCWSGEMVLMIGGCLMGMRMCWGWRIVVIDLR